MPKTHPVINLYNLNTQRFAYTGYADFALRRLQATRNFSGTLKQLIACAKEGAVIGGYVVTLRA